MQLASVVNVAYGLPRSVIGRAGDMNVPGGISPSAGWSSARSSAAIETSQVPLT
jgi:hypothetical protein